MHGNRMDELRNEVVEYTEEEKKKDKIKSKGRK